MTSSRAASVVVFLAFAGSVCLTGCRAEPEWKRAGAQPLESSEVGGWARLTEPSEPTPARARRWQGGVTAVSAARPSLPNTGLHLPRVSPDGRWVAFLDADSHADPPSRDGLVSGRGLDSVSLWVRPIDDNGLARNVAVGDVAWPSWSSDGQTLMFVSHRETVGAALALHDLETGTTRRVALGLRKLWCPALSPDKTRVAVSAYGSVADQSLLFLADLETGQSTPGPPPIFGGAQVLPVWLNAQNLLFIEITPDGGALLRWRVGDASAQVITALETPVSVFDTWQLHAGIAQPVSPDGRWFAYYSPANDRVFWVELATGKVVPLDPHGQAGTWWGDDWFVVGSQQRLDLTKPPAIQNQAAQTNDDEAELVRFNLLPGPWVPLWTHQQQQSLLLVGPDIEPGRFTVIQVWAVTEFEED